MCNIMSNSEKDNEKTVGQQTGAVIDTSVSFLDGLWDRHATKIVLLVLLVCLLVWYRKEVTETASSAVSSAAGAVSDAAGAVSGAASSAAGAVSGALTGSDAPAAQGAKLSAQVGSAELAGANAPTPAEIRALFDF